MVTVPAELRAGEIATLRFNLTDADGVPMQDLWSHHGRMLHVVLVSEDMQVFGHIHPEDFGRDIVAGEGKVDFMFPRPGRYLASADAMAANELVAEHFTVAVSGESAKGISDEGQAPPRLVVVEAAEDDVYVAPVLFEAAQPTGGYEVSLSRPGTIRAGEEVTLTWRFTKNGTPITDLRLFLDAAMHLAVVKEDLGQFVHAHGLPKGIETGYDHTHGPGGMENEPTDAREIRYFGPEVIAPIMFPEAGNYYLFGQSVHGDALLVSRVSIEVVE